MDEIGLVGQTSDMEFLIHVLNNLPEEYDDVLDEHWNLSERSKTQDLKGLPQMKEKKIAMNKLWLQDSRFSSMEHVASVVNMGTNQIHQSV